MDYLGIRSCLSSVLQWIEMDSLGIKPCFASLSQCTDISGGFVENQLLLQCDSAQRWIRCELTLASMPQCTEIDWFGIKPCLNAAVYRVPWWIRWTAGQCGGMSLLLQTLYHVGNCDGEAVGLSFTSTICVTAGSP